MENLNTQDNLASVILYEGGNDTLIYKYPAENFTLGSQLIVHESQEAICFRDGQALDLFGAGRYTLETQLLPKMDAVYKLPTDTKTTFSGSRERCRALISGTSARQSGHQDAQKCSTTCLPRKSCSETSRP